MLQSPLAGAINRRVAEQGGQPLRYRMLEGRAQFWVVLAEGKVVASARLRDLARDLGVSVKLNGADMAAEAVPKTISDPINIHRAVSITGYSATSLHRAARDGEVVFQDGPGEKNGRFSRASVVAWAEARRKMGGSYLPRKRRLATEVKRAARSTGGNTDRLGKYLAKLAGTPLEITRKDFIARAVVWALDRLEK